MGNNISDTHQRGRVLLLNTSNNNWCEGALGMLQTIKGDNDDNRLY